MRGNFQMSVSAHLKSVAWGALCAYNGIGHSN